MLKDRLYTFAPNNPRPPLGANGRLPHRERAGATDRADACLHLRGSLEASAAQSRPSRRACTWLRFPAAEDFENALDEARAKNWDRLLAVREEVLKALEPVRAAKTISASLEARVTPERDRRTWLALLQKYAAQSSGAVHRLASRNRTGRSSADRGARCEALADRRRARRGQEMRTLLELFDARRRERRIPDALRTLRRRRCAEIEQRSRAPRGLRKPLMRRPDTFGTGSALRVCSPSPCLRPIKRASIAVETFTDRRFAPRPDSRPLESRAHQQSRRRLWPARRLQHAVARAGADSFFRRRDRCYSRGCSSPAAPAAGSASAAWRLILGGAAGNVLDRVLRRSVTDFIDFHVGDYHWYTFNLADSAIVLGAALVVLELFRDWRHPSAGAGLDDASGPLSISARSPFTPTACWSRRAFSSGCGMRGGRLAGRARSPQSLESGHLQVLAALVVAKLWLIFSDWNYYAANPAISSASQRSNPAAPSMAECSGRFWRSSFTRLLRTCRFSRSWTFCRCAAARPRDRTARLLRRRLLLRQADRASLGRDVHRPSSGASGRHSAGTSLHPTQLYEAAAEFLNFLFLVWLGARQRFRGRSLGTYFILYGIERGIIEFFRGDPGRTMMFHDAVSLMQVVSVGLVLTGAFLWSGGVRRMGSSHPASPAPAAAGPALPEKSSMPENVEARGASGEAVELVVPIEQAGQRLDRFLVSQLPELSRSRIQALIDEGRVQVDGVAMKPSHRVESGETVLLEIPPPAPAGVQAEAIPLDVLYEDEDVAVINKPAGMIVHPGAGRASGTMVAALLHRFGGSAGPIHRGRAAAPRHRASSRQGTSGAILIARTDAAHRKLVEEFRDRLVEKTYVALLHGKIKGEAGSIDLPVARDLRRRSRMTARRREGREARTDWRARLRLDGFTLIEADLHTGRTHQIRVHFSALGCPVVGDTLYGAPRQERVGSRAPPAARPEFSSRRAPGLRHPRTRPEDRSARAAAARTRAVLEAARPRLRGRRGSD